MCITRRLWAQHVLQDCFPDAFALAAAVPSVPFMVRKRLWRSLCGRPYGHVQIPYPSDGDCGAAASGCPHGCDLLHDSGCALAQFVTCHNNGTAASLKVAGRLQDKATPSGHAGYSAVY